MKKRVLKKSEVLREGYVKGLKEAQSIINRMLKESNEQEHIADIWVRNMNAHIQECIEEDEKVPAISFGDAYYEMEYVEVEGDTVKVVSDEGDVFSFSKDALYGRTEDGSGFYLPVEEVLLDGKLIDPARTDDGYVLFWVF